MAKQEKAERQSWQETRSSKSASARMCRYGVAHIQASFNNTIVTITDQMGNTLSLEERGLAGIPRFAQRHAVRGAAGRVERRRHGARSRPPDSRRARCRSRIGPRVGHPRAGSRRHRSQVHPRRHAGAAQRLPSAEAAESLRTASASSAVSVASLDSTDLMADRLNGDSEL